MTTTLTTDHTSAAASDTPAPDTAAEPARIEATAASEQAEPGEPGDPVAVVQLDPAQVAQHLREHPRRITGHQGADRLRRRGGCPGPADRRSGRPGPRP